MNVLHRLNPSQAQYEAIYCSHFIEHIPSAAVPNFLARCRTLIARGGVFRVVVPDAEFLLREYLKHKESGNGVLAEFAYVNFLDQCVRHTRGGRLGELYREIASHRRPDLVEYAIYLNGTDMLGRSRAKTCEEGFMLKVRKLFRDPDRAFSGLERRYIFLISRLLPRGFREQNVSFADVGELHRWMYDFEQLSNLLSGAGFSTVVRQSFNTSRRSDGVFFPLDVLNGEPRKGHHQLFLEAYT